jgi:hypothetical protein
METAADEAQAVASLRGQRELLPSPTVGSYGTIFVPPRERLHNDLRRYTLDQQTRDIRERIEAPAAQHYAEADRAKHLSTLYLIGPGSHLVQERVKFMMRDKDRQHHKAELDEEREKLREWDPDMAVDMADLDADDKLTQAVGIGWSQQTTYVDALTRANKIPLHPPQKPKASHLRGADAIGMENYIQGGKYYMPAIGHSDPYAEKLEAKMTAAHAQTNPKMWPLDAMYPTSPHSKSSMLKKEQEVIDKFKYDKPLRDIKVGLAGSNKFDNKSTIDQRTSSVRSSADVMPKVSTNKSLKKDAASSSSQSAARRGRPIRPFSPLSPLTSGRNCSKSPPPNKESNTTISKNKNCKMSDLPSNGLHVGWPSVSTVTPSSNNSQNDDNSANISNSSGQRVAQKLSSLQQTLVECGRLKVIYDREHDKKAASVAKALETQKKMLTDHSRWLTSSTGGSDDNVSAELLHRHYKSLSAKNLEQHAQLEQAPRNARSAGEYNDDMSSVTGGASVRLMPPAHHHSDNRSRDTRSQTNKSNSNTHHHTANTQTSFTTRTNDLNSVNCHTVSTGYMEDIAQHIGAINMLALHKNPYREARNRPTIMNKQPPSVTNTDPMSYRQSYQVSRVGNMAACIKSNMFESSSRSGTLQVSEVNNSIASSSADGKRSGQQQHRRTNRSSLIIPSKHEVTASLTLLCRKALLRYDMKIVETGGFLKVT